MARDAKPGAGRGAPVETSACNLSAKTKLLRWSYYVLFWWLPYRRFTRRTRRLIARFYVAVYALFAAGHAIDNDFLGVAVFLAASILSAASLGLVDRDLEGGARVPRTRYNLPADLETKPASRRLVDPAEVARACAYLSSAESGLMTGSVICFDQSVWGAYDGSPHPVAPL